MGTVEIDGPAAFGTVGGHGVCWLSFRVTQKARYRVLASAAADLGMIDYWLFGPDQNTVLIGGPFKRQLTKELGRGKYFIKIKNRRPGVAAYRVRCNTLGPVHG